MQKDFWDSPLGFNSYKNLVSFSVSSSKTTLEFFHPGFARTTRIIANNYKGENRVCLKTISKSSPQQIVEFQLWSGTTWVWKFFLFLIKELTLCKMASKAIIIFPEIIVNLFAASCPASSQVSGDCQSLKSVLCPLGPLVLFSIAKEKNWQLWLWKHTWHSIPGKN